MDRIRLPALTVAALMAMPVPALADNSPSAAVLSLESAEGKLRLGPADIAEVKLASPAANGVAGIHLRVTPDAAAALAGLTARSVGQPMQVRACGHRLTAPVVRERIDSGVIYLQEQDAARARALHALWQGRSTCADLDTEIFQDGQ